MEKNPKLVVALDIGTTYSGYAWQWRGEFLTNPANVGLFPWKAGLCKTSTAILFSNFSKRTINSIGFTAEDRYAEQGGKPENKKTWRLFKNFKMPLYGENFNEDVRAEDVESQDHVPLKEIMTLFIQELKRHFVDDSLTKGQSVSDSEIRWVITVPAIWNVAAQHLMKQCAGSIDGISPSNLSIVLEPEAAAIYCIHLSKEERQSMGGLGDKDDSFILADLGGGTADFSVQSVADDGKLVQLCAAAGDRIGGQDINNAFFLACKDVFEGDSWFECWYKLEEDVRLRANHRFERDFEMRKIEIGRNASEEDEWVRVSLPKGLSDMIDLGKLRLKPESLNFSTRDGEFVFKSQYIRERLFDETIARVFEVLSKLMKQDGVAGVAKVVLVGGLSSSDIVITRLESRLNKEFPEKNIKVFAPKSPMYAVLQGAVIYGHEPDIFKTRISRFTYGVSTLVPFQKGKHPEDKKYWINSTAYCRGIFDIHVKRNQAVKINDKQPIRKYLSVYKDQSTMEIKLYETSDISPTYIDDKYCKHSATIEVTIPTGKTGEIDVTMAYGGNEIRVEAIEKHTGKPYRTQLLFQSVPNLEEQTHTESTRCILL